jgi:hypothetical protein
MRDARIAAAVNAITDSDLVALSMLRIRIPGYHALSFTGRLARKICDLLGHIPPKARIEDQDTNLLLAPGAPAWEL